MFLSIFKKFMDIVEPEMAQQFGTMDYFH